MKKILFCFLILFITACGSNKYEERSIEMWGCIVDSIEYKKSPVTGSRSFVYVYHTSCDMKITESGYRRYSVGDTIKFIYKKYEQKNEQKKNTAH
jgi:hypothetical protein